MTDFTAISAKRQRRSGPQRSAGGRLFDLSALARREDVPGVGRGPGHPTQHRGVRRCRRVSVLTR